MAFKELTQAEIDQVLEAERIMRVGFAADGESYLVPLGFVTHRGSLYAMTTKGRKTRMAAIQPKVSFQVDTASTTGPFSWQSVTGEGTFEVVTAAPEIEAVAALLTTRFPDMPAWMQEEYGERQKRGDVVFVRVRPSKMAGRRSEPA